MKKNETKKGSILGILIFVFIGIPSILQTFQSDMNMVDKVVQFGWSLPHPYDAYVISIAFVLMGYAINKLKELDF